MYLKHFRLRDRPFKLTQDLSYYFGPPHQIPLNELCYSIEEEQGVAMLVGGHGMGKTTVLKRLLLSLPANLHGILMSDHSLGGDSLVEQLAAMLHLKIPKNQPQLLAEHLKSQLLRGKKLVLLIDEAQALTLRQLEEVRFLTNLEHQGRRLTEIVLSGPPSLRDRLSLPELAGLRQRVAVSSAVEPLTGPQTESYIRHRLRVAGTDEPIFEGPAIDAIYDKTGGIPRLVNVLCDRALISAFARGLRRVDPPTVQAAEVDLKRFEAERMEERVAEDGAKAVSLSQLLSALERIEEKQDRILEMLLESARFTSNR
ncbi:MAG: ExeA family protein [Vicinamibacteria bacterium]